VKVQKAGECVYILGETYLFINEKDKEKVNEKIKIHLKSCLYFGYKYGFKMETMKGPVTSDAGWGCMLRVGQMMLA
jgi:hypothetical protein